MYRAELLKLRTTRAAWIVGVVAVIGMAIMQLFTLILPRVMDSLGGADALAASGDTTLPNDATLDLATFADASAPAFQRTVLSLLGTGPGSGGSVSIPLACALILGVLAITADFRTGGIVPTALVVPSRTRILLAKVGASATVAVAINVVLAILTALGLFTAILTTPEAGFALDLGEVLGVWGRGIAILVLFTWLGLGLGTLVRSQVAAILVVAAMLLIEPVLQVAVMLISGGGSAITSWLPLSLASVASTGQAASEVLGGAAVLTVGAAFVGLVLWAGSLLAGGLFSIRQRDLV